MTQSIDPARPPAHVRSDRIMREVAYPTTSIPHPIAQINFIAVSPTGQDCPDHYHQRLWETFVCLHGHLRFVITRKNRVTVINLTPGEQLIIEPGDTHGLTASPNSTYLELRSTRYQDELDSDLGPDKVFVNAGEKAWIDQMNKEAVRIP